MNKIFVTGAYGFIGQSVCQALVAVNKSVHGAVRSLNSFSTVADAEYTAVGDINFEINWKSLLANFDCVIHCAGRAHVMNEPNTDSLEAYRLANVEATKRLAMQAAAAGVKRMIFLSSVKVNGENTNESLYNLSLSKDKKKIFTYKDKPAPENSYGVSKLEAETALWEVSVKTGLEVIVLRLPLVYGEGVKGNLNRLLKLVRSGMPLPFGMIKNQRSMIGLDNLIDVIIRCIDHPKAAGKTFLLSDGEDLSTSDLLRHMASSMECSVRLLPIPVSLLKFAGFILKRQNEIDRLVGSLKVDSLYTREILDWTPRVSVEQGIRQMVISNLKS